MDEYMECSSYPSQETAEQSHDPIREETKAGINENRENQEETDENRRKKHENKIKQDINKFLLELAEEVPDKWQFLAIHLNIGSKKIKEIELEQRRVVRQGHTMLQEWFDLQDISKHSWYKELADAFESIGKKALAQTIITKGRKFHEEYRTLS